MFKLQYHRLFPLSCSIANFCEWLHPVASQGRGDAKTLTGLPFSQRGNDALVVLSEMNRLIALGNLSLIDL